MNNQRFPRRKFVRALIRVEDELAAWAAWFGARASTTSDTKEEAFASDRQGLLSEVARQVHAAADLLSEVPMRSRSAWRQTPLELD